MSAGAGERIARGGGRNLLFRLAQSGSDFLVVVVTARVFGADGRGLYALASAAAAFAIVPLGGVSVPLVAELAHGRASRGRLHAVSLLVALGGGLVLAAALGGAAAARWPDWRFLAYAGAAAPFLALAVFQQELFRAEGDVRRMSWMALCQSLAGLAALGGAGLAWRGIGPALAAWAAAQAVVPLATLALVRRRTPLDWTGAGALARRVLARGAPVSAANAAARLNYRVDVFVVAALLPTSRLGVYSVAVALGEALLQLSRAVTTGAYFALVGRAPEESARLSRRTFRHVVLVLAVAGAAGVALARVLLGPLFGDAFRAAWLPLAVLVPGIVALGAGEVLQPFLLVRLERSRDYLGAYVAATAANLALAVLLVPPLGLAGAALSTTVAYLAAAGYLLARFARLAGAAAGPRAYLPGRAELADYRRVLRALRRARRRPRVGGLGSGSTPRRLRAARARAGRAGSPGRPA